MESMLLFVSNRRRRKDTSLMASPLSSSRLSWPLIRLELLREEGKLSHFSALKFNVKSCYGKEV